MERGIRFIAINDSIDTMQENNDIAAFHHVLNEFYPKQVSKKVRQVKHAGTRQGKFMNSQAPYGYQKSPQDKHILIVDEDAARIVRRLFTEYAGGDNARMIADRLNAERIDSPRFYHYAKMGRENPLSNQKNVWGSATIMQLLRNQAYIGNMVQGKREVISFKTKKFGCLIRRTGLLSRTPTNLSFPANCGTGYIHGWKQDTVSMKPKGRLLICLPAS